MSEPMTARGKALVRRYYRGGQAVATGDVVAIELQAVDRLRAIIEMEIAHAVANGHRLDRDCQGVGPGEVVTAVRVDALRAALDL